MARRVWREFLERVVAEPSVWHMSHRMPSMKAAKLAQDQFQAGTRPHAYTKNLVTSGVKGTWHYTFGVTDDGFGFNFYFYCKWVPEGADPGEMLPKNLYRPHKGHRNLRKLGRYDFRTQRSGGDR